MKSKIENLKLPVELSDIEEASKLISNDIVRTQLLYADALSKLSGGEIWIKPENFQRVKSFKIRGALNKIKHLTSEQKSKGVIAPSAGNHAQGVAYGSTLEGIKSIIVMPSNAPLSKINATKGYGGEVVLADGITFDDACALAKKLENEKGLTFLHAFDDKYVIAGQGTIGLEIMEQMKDVDMVIVPVGGGGIIAGIAVAVKAINPKVEIIGVEPECFNCMQTAILNKGCQTLTNIKKTIADGTAVKTAGNLTYQISNALVDEIVTVTEEEIEDAMVFLLEKNKIVAEGAGALATAAILSKKVDVKNKKVINIVSGGNVDLDKLLIAINNSLARKK